MIVPDFSMTTLQAAQANVLTAITAQIVNLNNNLKTDYLTRFNNWAISVSAGRTDCSNPPLPPKAYVVGQFVDPTSTAASGDILWSYPTEGYDVVCDMPPIPLVPKPFVPPVLTEPTNIRNVPAGDTLPVGYQATAPDGSKWQKQASPTPFGMAYYYSRVS